jgi:hypothetical protein
VRLALCLAALVACTPAPPKPAPVFSDAAPPPAALPPATIYGELLEGGCIAPDDPDAQGQGLAAVVEEEYSDAELPLIACLFGGGSVASCGGCGAGQ